MRPVFLACAAMGIAVAGVARADDPARPPLYYQDPDGKPLYAASPAKTADGREYKPVFVDGPTTQAIAEPKPSAGDRHILYYRNPMGLADTSPGPKKDAMGMDYVPVYADEATQGDPAGTVRITAGRVQTLGVRTASVEMRPAVARAIRATGILQFDERHLTTVTTKVSGWIDRLVMAATGDPVRRGQVLAEIYSPDMVASEEEYLVAASMGGAIGAASGERLRALDIPDDEIARLRRTGHAARRIAVVASADGVIIDKPVQEGMRVDAGQPLYKIADLSNLWLIAQVQEQDLASVVIGAQAAVTFVAFPGRTFEGRVDFIYPSMSAETRTASVRIVLANPDRSLLSGMYATAGIDAPSGVATLSVPHSAVLDNGQRQVVLVALGGGRFEPRTVQIGVRGDEWDQVLSGLNPDEQVVVDANFLIDAESDLTAALQGFAAGSSGTKP